MLFEFLKQSISHTERNLGRRVVNLLIDGRSIVAATSHLDYLSGNCGCELGETFFGNLVASLGFYGFGTCRFLNLRMEESFGRRVDFHFYLCHRHRSDEIGDNE